MSVDISVVIPVYNSERTLDELYHRLSFQLQSVKCNYEIIFVDDGSTDDSFLVLKRLQHIDKKVQVIRTIQNKGQQKAIYQGFKEAKGDIIITLDDDLQHPPEELPKLLIKIEEGYDLVFGIPQKKKHSFFRNIGTVLTDKVFILAGLKPDSLKISSFRGFNKEVLQDSKIEKQKFIYISAELLKHAKRAGNVVIEHDERRYGKSNYSLIKLGKLLLDLYLHYYLWAEKRKVK